MKKLIFSITVLFLISFSVLTVIIFNTNPQTSAFNVFAFYFCLWLAIWSLLMILIMTIYRFDKAKQKIVVLARRSFLLSIAVVGILFFSSINVLNLLSAFSLVFAAFLLEMFFINKKIEKSK